MAHKLCDPGLKDTVLLEGLLRHKGQHKKKALFINDILCDIDDYAAVFVQKALADIGLLEVIGSVTTGQLTRDRADFQAFIYAALGMNVPCAEGSAGTNETREQFNFELRNKTFIDHGREIRRASGDLSAHVLLRRAFEDAVNTNDPLTLVLEASLRDIATFFDWVIRLKGADGAGDYFRKALDTIVFQGGPYTVDENDEVIPDSDSANNMWDWEAAQKFWSLVHRYRLPVVSVSKHVAAASALKRSQLCDLPGLVGSDFNMVLDRVICKFAADPYYHMYFTPVSDLSWFLRIRGRMTAGTENFESVRERLDQRSMSLRDMMTLAYIPLYDAVAVVVALIPEDLLDKIDVLDRCSDDYDEARRQCRCFGRSTTNLGGLNAERLTQILSALIRCGVREDLSDHHHYTNLSIEYTWPEDSVADIVQTIDLIENGPPAKLSELGRRYRRLAEQQSADGANIPAIQKSMGEVLAQYTEMRAKSKMADEWIYNLTELDRLHQSILSGSMDERARYSQLWKQLHLGKLLFCHNTRLISELGTKAAEIGFDVSTGTFSRVCSKEE